MKLATAAQALKRAPATIKELTERILELKHARGAIILAHNYQIAEVQDIADFVGDSLELSQKASKTDAEVIVFCGVHFMAETASILCPDKLVIMPDISAGCPMADMITPENLSALKAEHPEAIVVAYVNTTAEVKAESDVCCTSANAQRLVETLSNQYQEIIFIPDQYLGSYVSKQAKKPLILYPGYCPPHMMITADEILSLKQAHPNAEIVVHPECRPEVIEVADAVRSTSGICKYAHETPAQELIIGTEVGIIHRLKKELPHKSFYPASKRAICPNMKKHNLEKILWALEELKEQVVVPEDIRKRAKQAVDRMLALT